MSYRLRGVPSPRSTATELADFLEVECLISSSGVFSVTEAAQEMGVVDDESTPEDEERDAIECFRNSLSLIEDRNRMTNNHYPFRSNVLSVEFDKECDSLSRDVYIFLLLATRENMRDNKKVNELDGTLLFERLCAEILKNFFGEHSCTFILGTGNLDKTSFQVKLQELLDSFREKGYCVTPVPNNPYYKDAGIDVIAFIPFHDERHGHFVCFAQCKTGTSWESCISRLQPIVLTDYIQPPLAPIPGKMFLISDDYQERDWRDKINILQGVLFDRTRLMAYLPESIDAELHTAIIEWNKGVLNRCNLHS